MAMVDRIAMAISSAVYFTTSRTKRRQEGRVSEEADTSLLVSAV